MQYCKIEKKRCIFVKENLHAKCKYHYTVS